METKKIHPTVITPLETSERKNERVRSAIEDWQKLLSTVADYMPSIGENNWRPYDTTVNHIVDNQGHDHNLRKHEANLAGYEVAQAYKRYAQQPGATKPQFDGDGDYMKLCSCALTLLNNDPGYALKINLQPYNPEHFDILAADYHAKKFDYALENGIEPTVSELRLSECGELEACITLSRNVEVHDPDKVDRTVGVDLGERVLYAATVMEDGEVQDVDIKRGREFRHNRERLKKKRTKMMQRGDLTGVKKCRDEHYRYTDHVTHVASRELVNFASEHQPATIVFEDLTNYRKNAKDPIHDWPYGELQRKTVEKATAERIPVKFVNPAGTSYTCSSCGHGDRDSRDGANFRCVECGYTVHADVNAAKNISSSAFRESPQN